VALLAGLLDQDMALADEGALRDRPNAVAWEQRTRGQARAPCAVRIHYDLTSKSRALEPIVRKTAR